MSGAVDRVGLVSEGHGRSDCTFRATGRGADPRDTRLVLQVTSVADVSPRFDSHRSIIAARSLGAAGLIALQ